MSTLGDLVTKGGIQTGPFGSQLHASDYTHHGVGVVMPQDLGDNVVNPADMARVATSTAQALSRHQLLPGDIVFSRRGDVTRRSIIRHGDGDLLCGTGCLRVRLNLELADPVFISYALAVQETRDWLVRHAVGATMPNLNTGILSSVPLHPPQLKVQQAVGEVLGALDDKITANRRAVRVADGLARARASRTTAGSRQVALGDVCALISRGVAPRYAADGFLVLNQKCVREGRVDLQASRTMKTLPKDSAKILQAEDVLVNSTGQGTLGRVARWTKPYAETSVDSHISIVRIDEDVADPSFVGMLLLDYESRIGALAEGSTGQTELRQQALAMLPLRLPSLDDQREVGGLVRALSCFMDAKDDENLRLAATRDELLPLLMSGKITVKDAEKAVEEVV